MSAALDLLKAALRPSRRARYLRRALRGGTADPALFLDLARRLGITAIEAEYLGRYRALLDVSGRSITHDVLSHGAFQPELFARFATVFAARDCLFVNVGANIGTTCLNAHAAGFGEILAFEPVQNNLALLRHNLAALPGGGQAEIRPLGLGTEAGEAEIFLNPASGGRHSLTDDFGAGTETISLSTLDAEAPARDGVLWIDTEGFEAEVLRGGEGYLRQHCRALCIEVTPALLSPTDLVYLDRISNEIFSRAVTLEEDVGRIGDIGAIRAGSQTDVILLR